jgi:hypothetical protein
MFHQVIAIIRGSTYLTSYPSNICIVDVYGLRFVQCGQLPSDATNVLHTKRKDTNILKTVQRKKANLIGHMLRRNCLPKHVTEGDIKGRSDGKARKKT